MADATCFRHNCAVTGIGSFSFCPRCQEEEDYGDIPDMYGYYTDLFMDVSHLYTNADGIEIYESLEYLEEQILSVLSKSKQNKPSITVSIKIYRAKRVDGEPFEFSKVLIDKTIVKTSLVLGGFKGCGWSKPNWMLADKNDNSPKAELEFSPVKTITEKNV